MAGYIWQLGIDWNAIQTGGVGYLRGGLATMGGERLPGTEAVKKDDTIIFRIFDVTSPLPPATLPPGRCVDEIMSFGIDYQGAVKDQPTEKPLDNTQPTIASPNESAQSSLFGNAYCSWESEQVTVTTPPARFLLTVYLQATGLDGVVRLFNHDPEMVVGPFG